MKVHFQALGCRLNEAEVENWSQQFIRQGHQLTMDSGEADLVVFNSCSVTSAADRKSRKLINRIHRENPQSKLVVTGCYASLQSDQVKQQLGVDLVIDNQRKDQLVDHVLNEFDVPTNAGDDFHQQSSIFSRGRHRAFIKVQDGCRYRCTFCIVTVARGEERSRSSADIIDEIRMYHQQGVQEVVLTGVHVGGYGSDNDSNLYQLIAEILDKTEIPRLRLASVEPWDLPDYFFQLFTESRLMPHMHLPLQSGADSVLRRMARRCKTTEFARLLEKARSVDTLFNVTTDLIVGFPGETEAEWQETLHFAEQMEFGDMHVFAYSPREGTKAARLPDQISSEIKKERSQQMIELAKNMKMKNLAQHINQRYPVLWEQQLNEQERIWSGYTPHYHKVLSAPGKLKTLEQETIIIGELEPQLLMLKQQNQLQVA